MKTIIGLLIVIYSLISNSHGQISFKTVNNLFNGEKLQMTIEIENQTSDSVFIQIEADKLVTQLSNAKKDDQLVKNTTHLFFPSAFVIYYKQDSIIDDIVFRTDHRLPTSIGLTIHKQSRKHIEMSNDFIGNMTLDLLNRKQEIYFELYIIYRCNGMLKYAKTKKMKVMYS